MLLAISVIAQQTGTVLIPVCCANVLCFNYLSATAHTFSFSVIADLIGNLLRTGREWGRRDTKS